MVTVLTKCNYSLGRGKRSGYSRERNGERFVTLLRVDPWDPEYGASTVDLLLEEAPQAVDFAVEDRAWDPISPARPDDLPCCAFVDGVRRIDVRLFAEEDGSVAPALAGSWAVGSAWSTRPPKIGEVTVGRSLVVGGGLTHPDLTVHVGADDCVYRYVGVGGSDPLDPITGLQNAMRAAEARLAEEVFGLGRADLVIQDGPLTYFVNGPVIGLIKRQSRAYLPPERHTILARLTPAERTPLFRLGEQRLERYSWYTRIAVGRRIDGAMTGIVRLEVPAEVGVMQAQQLADLATSTMPHFASAVGHDPRAPQNLYPVGQLERVLRHRLGDPELLKRALEVCLWEAYV
jgi:hypothetical protein